MSGPHGETLPAYWVVSDDVESITALAGSRWPLRIAITGGLEPGIIITCRRCDAPVLELCAREAEGGYPTSPTALGQLVSDHVPLCMSGRPPLEG